MKKLIEVRQAYTALQSKGEVEFLYAEEKSYPFAYMRSDGGEKILVVLNPSDKEVQFECGLELEKSIYSLGGMIKKQNENLIVPACSANFCLLNNEK